MRYGSDARACGKDTHARGAVQKLPRDKRPSTCGHIHRGAHRAVVSRSSCNVA